MSSPLTLRFTESAALEYPCPECPAKPRQHCRKPASRVWRITKPHPERVQVAYRAWLKADQG